MAAWLCFAQTAFSGTVPPQTERWGIFQLNLTAQVGAGNPFATPLSATFTHQDGVRTVTVSGFFDGDDQFRVRFSPPIEGLWSYVTASTETALEGVHGELLVTPALAAQRGPVESRGFGLYYADGTPHLSVGTTCYQWTSKDVETQEQTLQTLAASGFNKIRMTILPKWYVYNHANPVQAGCAYKVLPGSVAANATAWGCVGSSCPPTAGSFDLRRFNVSYWRNFENLLGRLRAMDVVVDLILFHPYDGGHWGFDCMGGRDADSYDTASDKFYLRYAAARLAAYSNVWWSMANEWSLNTCKGRGVVPKLSPTPSPVWDELFGTLRAADPYGRQASMHNGPLLYNHSRPWITHVSLQGHMTDTPQLRARYGKPVVWDEQKYEGDIPEGWGALSGAQEVDRFWWALSLGVHAGHSETILRADTRDDAQPLWWGKGGTLVGEAPRRVAWFRGWVEAALHAQQLDFGAMQPAMLPRGCAVPAATSVTPVSAAVARTTDTSDAAAPACWGSVLGAEGAFYLVHFFASGSWVVPLPHMPHGWRVDAVDFYNMTERPLGSPPAGASGVPVAVAAVPYNVVIRSS